METKKRVLEFVPLTIIVFLTTYFPLSKEDKKENRLLLRTKQDLITLN